MINTLTKYTPIGHHFYGLEVCQFKDGQRFFLIKVRRRKKELESAEQMAFEDLETMGKSIKPSIPLFLTVNTKDVITKNARDSKLEDKALANSLFPNMDYDLLYFEIYSLGSERFVSIVRKNIVSDILNKLIALKVSIFSISIGLSGVRPLLDYINENEIVGTTYKLIKEPPNKGITIANIEQEDDQFYNLSGLQVQNWYLLGFGSVASHLLLPTKTNSSMVALNEGLGAEVKNKKLLSLLTSSSVLLFLGVLLINFLFFDHFRSSIQNLTDKQAINAKSLEQISQLKERVESKERRLEKALSTSNSKVSFYLDELGQTVPNTITLEEMVYQPLLKSKKDSNPIAYTLNEIRITGLTGNGVDFSQWVAEMERLNWVNQVKTLEYDYQTKKTSMFELRVFIND